MDPEDTALLEFLPTKDVKILKNEPLSRHSSMKTGGPAAVAAFPKTTDALVSLIHAANEHRMHYTVIGNASNVLFDDRGFDGIVIFTTGLRGVRWEENTVRAECGASLTALAGMAAGRGLSGLEFAYGIPGTVGGAVYMNAGAYGSEISDILVSSEYLREGRILTREKSGHAFSYRSGIYQKTGEIILSASFLLTPDDAVAVKSRSDENLRARKEKQPLEYPNAGSIFKRPEGAAAGALIESAGLKGLRVGGAAVSEKHAGFIVNLGDATTEDILRLMEMIQKEVCRQTGVLLEPEVIHLQ